MKIQNCLKQKSFKNRKLWLEFSCWRKLRFYLIFCWAVDNAYSRKNNFYSRKNNFYSRKNNFYSCKNGFFCWAVDIVKSCKKTGFYICYVEWKLLNVITVNISITSWCYKECNEDSLAVLQSYPIKKYFMVFVIFTYCN